MTTTIDDTARYLDLANGRLARAARVRSRARDIEPSLEPLRRAMLRRAAELELAGMALREIATADASLPQAG